MLPEFLLRQLADGAARPRGALAAQLGLGTADLDEGLAALREAGLEIVAGADGTVGLAEPVTWIDPAVIRRLLPAATLARIARLEHALVLESTNRHLLAAPPPESGFAHLALAEYQHGGRGRRGRRWSMPPGAGLALSAAWRFDAMPAGLSALSLAVGAVVRRALRAVAGLDVGLKWPNDLVFAGGKLGGILVELDRLRDGSCHVVAGIGINVRVPPAYLAEVSDWRHGARDLAGATGGERIDRAALAAAIIGELIELFASYPERGFAPYRPEWLEAHVLDGQPVEVTSLAVATRGVVRGIDADGALLVEDGAGKRQRIVSGDVSVRMAP